MENIIKNVNNNDIKDGAFVIPEGIARLRSAAV